MFPEIYFFRVGGTANENGMGEKENRERAMASASKRDEEWITVVTAANR